MWDVLRRINVLRRAPSPFCSFYHLFPIGLNNGYLGFRTSNNWMILNSWNSVTFHFSEKEKKKLFSLLDLEIQISILRKYPLEINLNNNIYAYPSNRRKYNHILKSIIFWSMLKKWRKSMKYSGNRMMIENKKNCKVRHL